MNDHDDRHDELDQRIRDLVARAAADTPPAPRLDEGALVPNHEPTDRSRWIAGGVAGLFTAAAMVAVFLFTRPDERADPLVPATQSTIMVTLPSTIPGSTATLAPIPASTPDRTTTTVVATTSTTTSSPATTSPATTVPATVAPEDPPAMADLVVAGPDGVRRDDTAITTEPMARALPMPDGRTLMQRQYNTSGAVADSALLVVQPGSTEPAPIDVPAEFDGRVLRLHDLATIDGEVVVVVETRPEQCPNPENCLGAIWAWGPVSGRLDQLQEKIVWEGGWTRLSITEGGLVFGAETESAQSSLRSWIVPGTDAAPIDVAALGLEPSYGDCTDCPTGFTVDRRGIYVAWIETDLTTFQTTLVLAEARPDNGTYSIDRFPLTDAGTVCCLDDTGPDLPIIPTVEIELTVIGDAGDIDIVINDEGVLNGGDPRPALVVDLGTGDVIAAPGFHVFG